MKTAIPLSWMHMFDGQNGYGCSMDDHVMVTSDGGTTWTDVTPQGYIGGFGAVDFVDAKTGWAFKLQDGKSVTDFAGYID